MHLSFYQTCIKNFFFFFKRRSGTPLILLKEWSCAASVLGGSFSLKREEEMSTLRSPKEFIITSCEENKAVRLSCIAYLGL